MTNKDFVGLSCCMRTAASYTKFWREYGSRQSGKRPEGLSRELEGSDRDGP